MYEAYWQLDQKPFDSTADFRFYYPSETHQAAALKLQYAVESYRMGALLAGWSGVGKTLLVGWLQTQLSASIQPQLRLVLPQLSPTELLRWVADSLDPSADAPHSADSDTLVRRIAGRLGQLHQSGHRPLLVVEEAHLLDEPQLETLRLLMNFNDAHEGGLTILLVGQPTLLPTIHRFSALEERLGVKCLLRPFTLDETMGYVAHRLQAAGSQRALFDSGALETLHELSGGVARRIDRLADLALLVGYAEQVKQVERSHVEAVCEELVAVRPE